MDIYGSHTWTQGQYYSTNFELYILAFYYVTATMTSVGYGDVSASNTMERSVSIITMLISTGVFAYSVSLIGSIIKELKQINEKRKQRMFIISSFMEQKGIARDLQNNIREYLAYLDENENQENKDEEEKIISQLPFPLKLKLRKQVYKTALKIFNKHFSKEFLEKMLDIIQEGNYRPHEIIHNPAEQQESTLYFVNKGRAKLIPKRDNGYHHRVLQGDSYGLLEFFNGKQISCQLESMQFSQIFKIKRTQFIDLLKQFPEDFQKFCEIKDKINIQNNYNSLPLHCYMCKQKHLLKECGTVHFDHMKYKLKCKQMQTLREKTTIFQKRQPAKQERDQEKFPTLRNLTNIVFDAIEFIDDNLEKSEEIQRISTSQADQVIIQNQQYPSSILAYHNMSSYYWKQRNTETVIPNVSVANLNVQRQQSFNSPKRNKSSLSQQDMDEDENTQLPIRKNHYNLHNNESQKLQRQVQFQLQIQKKKKQKQNNNNFSRNSSVSPSKDQEESEANSPFYFPRKNLPPSSGYDSSETSSPKQKKSGYWGAQTGGPQFNRCMSFPKNVENNFYRSQSNGYSQDYQIYTHPAQNIYKQQQSQYSLYNSQNLGVKSKRGTIVLQQREQSNYLKEIYSIILQKYVIVGNQQVHFMMPEELDKKQNWKNYYVRHNYDEIVPKLNHIIKQKLIQIISNQRRKSQKHLQNRSKIKQPTRSLSQPPTDQLIQSLSNISEDCQKQQLNIILQQNQQLLSLPIKKR